MSDYETIDCVVYRYTNPASSSFGPNVYVANATLVINNEYYRILAKFTVKIPKAKARDVPFLGELIINAD